MKRIALAVVAALSMGFGQAASAADLPVRVPATPVVAPSWTGFYVGVHAGWGWTSTENASSAVDLVGGGTSPSLPQTLNLDSDDPIAGAQLGYNWQTANWVFGIEGDASGTGLKSTQNGASITGAGGIGACAPGAQCGTVTMSEDVKWLASVRGRIGAIVGPGMVYVTGGGAWAGVDYSANAAEAINPGLVFFPAAMTSTVSGAVAGGGYEWMINNNWTLRGEFLHYWFKGVTTTANGAPTPFIAPYSWSGFNLNAARLAVNYKF
jgi:outer membrane immunogenic protein